MVKQWGGIQGALTASSNDSDLYRHEGGESDFSVSTSSATDCLVQIDLLCNCLLCLRGHLPIRQHYVTALKSCLSSELLWWKHQTCFASAAFDAQLKAEFSCRARTCGETWQFILDTCSGFIQQCKTKGKKEWINDRNLKQGSFQITHWAQIWFPAEAYESPLLVPGQNCTSFLGAIRPAQVSTSDSSDKAFSLKVSRRTQARWKMSPTKKEQKIGKEVSISIQQEGKYSLGAERSQKALPTLRFNCHTQIIITKKNRDCTFKSGIKRRLYIGSFMCKSVCSVRQVQAEAAA